MVATTVTNPPAAAQASPSLALTTSPVGAIYLRVSSAKQKEGYSIPIQLERCQSLAEQEGIHVPADYIFVEDVTGTTLNRPELPKVRALVRTRQIHNLIIFDPDRLGRNLANQLLLLEEAEQAHVRLLFAQHPLEPGDDGRLLFQIHGAFAEYEHRKIKERTKAGLLARSQAHNPGGGLVSLGYRYESAPHAGAWVKDAERAAIYEHMVTLCLQGMPTRAIARQLTNTQVLTQSDSYYRIKHPDEDYTNRPLKAWSHQTVYKILSNPAYLGTAYWGKHENITKTTRRRRPQEEWESFDIPKLIDPERFAQVQHALSQHKQKARRNRKHEYLLSGGRLRCARCGRSMGGVPRRKTFAYRCRSYDSLSDPQLRCRGTVSATVLDTYVWGKVAQLLQQPEVIMLEVNRQRGDADAAREKAQHEIDLITAVLKKCDRQMKRWNDAYDAEIIDMAEFKVYRGDIVARQEHYQRELADWQATLASIDEQVTQTDALMLYCERIREGLRTFDAEEKQRAIEALNIRVSWQPGADPVIKATIEPDDIVSISSWHN